MAKARLLQAVCTVAMLAAAPAFAQTGSEAESTGAGNSVKAPAAHNTPTTGGTMSTSQSSPMTPASGMGSLNGSGPSGAMNSQSTHRSAMAGHSMAMRHGQSDTSQDAAVDQLNDQSYQAAQRGEGFGASNTGFGAMTAPSGTGSMHNMPDESPSGASGTSSDPGTGMK